MRVLPHSTAEGSQERSLVGNAGGSPTRLSAPCESHGDGLKSPPGSAFKLAMTKAAQAKVIPRNGPQILANAYLSSHTSHGEDKMLNRLFGKLVGLEIRSREAWADPSYCTVEDDLQL